MLKNYTLSVLVEDKPGVLTRISGLLARRAYNIISLAVGPSEEPGLSRMTIVTQSTAESIEQIKKQLNKLIQVIDIVQLPDNHSVHRDHVLIKVAAEGAERIQITQAVDLFRARVVDITSESLMIEATGNAEKILALIDILEPFGIIETVQSGIIAMARGNFDPAKVQVKPKRHPDNSSQMTV